MSKLSGTSVVKLSLFLDNLANIAGTRFITRSEYDDNIDKICSFSHVNRLFNMTWNDCLTLAGIPVKRKLPFPSTQGRKPKDTSMVKTVECLRCLEEFESLDPRVNRICKKCKDLCDQEED